MKKLLLLLSLLAAAAVPADRARAAVVLSGDLTPIFYLTDTAPNAAVAANRTFFTNVLGTGTQVGVSDNSVNALSTAEVNEFYDSLAGVSSGILMGNITAPALSGLDLFILAGPTFDLTASEIAALDAFEASGGTLFLMGEGVSAGTVTPRMNAVLSGIGSLMSLNTDNFDIGNQTATGTEVLANPLTVGTDGFSYGATSTINGGTGLFLTNDRAVFVAAEGFETGIIPLPAGAWLLVTGLGALSVVRSRRRT